tara:strand:- start:10609 stop:11187 length:579 start_codon:yes stop_codon:yes gene_type:complete
MSGIKEVFLEKNKSRSCISVAAILTALVLLSSFWSLGFWTMVIISAGFVGGFFLWLGFKSKANYDDLKWPFIFTFMAFVIHRVEEKVSGFFERLSEITDVSTPEILSVPVILMVVTSVGSWLSIPYLLKRDSEFGRYLIWTFFTSMGLTELAHIFVFPFVVREPFSYFPGMASVFLLSPLGWLGIYRMLKFK